MATRESLVSNFFGAEHASTYDERAKRFGPLRNALDFLIRAALRDLPKQSRILCVGAGTGAEMIGLAICYPEWQFTAVEPSGAMLEIARKKAADAGVIERCEFHEGFLETLANSKPFDAATSILVSQFLMDPSQRRDYFSEIAKRLSPGGRLINADLAAPVEPAAFDGLFEIWKNCLESSSEDLTPAQMGWGKDVAVSSPDVVAAIIRAAGFEQPLLLFNALFVHAWIAQVG